MNRCWPFVAVIALLFSLLSPALLAAAPVRKEPSARPAPAETAVSGGIQAFFERHGSGLASTSFGEHTAAEVIEGYTSYYSLNPRVVLTLLELVPGLISSPTAEASLLRQPLSPVGPEGFERHIEWAVRELRAGLGPFEVAPTVTFRGGAEHTLSLQQDPELIAVQLLLAKGRGEAEWTKLMSRYAEVYERLFAGEPAPPVATPMAARPFLADPWPTGTRVIHSSWFDHVYPMVDVAGDGNELMVDYLGRAGLSYNSHDGHDFYFPEQPYGTPILSAAPGWAYASTMRGNGVVIRHSGEAEGYETVYWHLADFADSFKDLVDSNTPVWVERGAFLGWSGASGFTNGAPHLHFEVRHNGKQVDPFGWYGPGDDPCAKYYACESSIWLWESSSSWQRPDQTATEDTTAPAGLLTVNPDPDLLLAARFDGTSLPDVGQGQTFALAPMFEEGRFGQALRAVPESRLSYPVSGNLELEQGTLAFWSLVPQEFPATGTGRNYLVAASEHPNDPAGIYSDTFALRYEAARGERPALWSFWTVSGSGQPHSLAVLDELEPGWHHFAVSWSKARGAKQLYIDGELAATAVGVKLPDRLSGRLELGRWYLNSSVSDARLDELAIWRTPLTAARIAELAGGDRSLPISREVLPDPELHLVTQAWDDGGGIVQIQLGIDGAFSQPMPYFSGYRWQLPAEEGAHEVAVRYVDRAGNTTTITRSVELNYPPRGVARLAEVTPLSATVQLIPSAGDEPVEMLLSARRDGADGVWEPFATQRNWRWRPAAERILYVRFRDAAGSESRPLMLSADGPHVYLPFTAR